MKFWTKNIFKAALCGATIVYLTGCIQPSPPEKTLTVPVKAIEIAISPSVPRGGFWANYNYDKCVHKVKDWAKSYLRPTGGRGTLKLTINEAYVTKTVVQPKGVGDMLKCILTLSQDVVYQGNVNLLFEYVDYKGSVSKERLSISSNQNGSQSGSQSGLQSGSQEGDWMAEQKLYEDIIKKLSAETKKILPFLLSP